VSTLLGDEEWSKKSDNWVAETCAVNKHLVAEVRGAINGSTGSSPSSKRIGRDGKNRPSSQPKRTSDEKPAKQPEPEKAAPPEKVINDPNGVPIPKKLREVFDAQPEFRSIVQQLGKTLGSIDELRKTPAGVILAERFERIRADIHNAQRELKFSMPHAVCPYCKGAGCKRTGADKTPCRETGWAVKGMTGAGE
jgi:hypothetical protein